MEVDVPERSVELAQVIDRAIALALADLYVCQPAVVVKITTDAAGNILHVNCKPLVKRPDVDEGDDRVADSRPTVPHVPVFYPGGARHRATFPLSDGNVVLDGDPGPMPATTGLLVYTDGSLDRWLSGGGQEVDPEIDETHAPHNAIFLPVVRPFGSPWSSVPGDHATLGADDGKQIHMRKATICVGDEAGAAFFVRDGDNAGTIELIGGIGSLFGGIKYTAPGGAITTLTATGVQAKLVVAASATQAKGS